MSIEIAVTPKELRTLRTLLTREKELVCLDRTVYVKVLLVAQNLLLAGRKVTAKIVAPLKRAEGQSIVEYALILGVIAVVVVLVVRQVGTSTNVVFSNVNSAITGSN